MVRRGHCSHFRSPKLLLTNDLSAARAPGQAPIVLSPCCAKDIRAPTCHIVRWNIVSHLSSHIQGTSWGRSSSCSMLARVSGRLGEAGPEDCASSEICEDPITRRASDTSLRFSSPESRSRMQLLSNRGSGFDLCSPRHRVPFPAPANPRLAAKIIGLFAVATPTSLKGKACAKSGSRCHPYRCITSTFHFSLRTSSVSRAAQRAR